MRPICLDLFCGAGGAAMGYHRAGFEVVGVDNQPQPRYPFQFVQMDALKAMDVLLSGGYIFETNPSLFDDKHSWRLSDFAAVHASPPCQAFCALKSMPNFRKGKHLNLIPQTRDALRKMRLPYVIENVPGAPLENPVVLCGSMFGLQTTCGAQLRRHRLFETNWPLVCDLECRHHDGSQRSISVTGSGLPVGGRTISVHGTHARDPWLTKNRTRVITCVAHTAQTNVVRNQVRETFSVREAGIAMGIDWMPMSGLSQAIPPAYTEFIGRQIMLYVIDSARVLQVV